MWKWLKLLQDNSQNNFYFENKVFVKKKNSHIKFCDDENKMADWNPTLKNGKIEEKSNKKFK